MSEAIIPAEGILRVIGEGSPQLALVIIFGVRSILGRFITNTATAVLIAPVGLSVAMDPGASAYPLAMMVMLGAARRS